MSRLDRRRAADAALAIGREAAQIVMRVYAQEFSVEYKAKDDPVTRADREANALICERLAAAFPGVPIVAEESAPESYAGFTAADAVWFVDPLDGTREFVARNGEFAVMLGLAEGGAATVGVIVAPVWERAFVGVVGEGAWEVHRDGSRSPIRVSPRAELAGASFAISRSRDPEGVRRTALAMGARRADSHGSSGLKGALVATGAYDVYLQPNHAGMRWDACATEGLVRAAGGQCTETDGTAIDYRRPELLNDRGLLADNGLLHSAIVEALGRRGP